MFYLLLLTTLFVALLSSFLVFKFFRNAIKGVLELIVPQELTKAWLKYLRFAIYIVGVSSGVRVWEIERYMPGQGDGRETLVLTNQRWVLEVYRALIEALQSISTLLLVFFIFALLAYVITSVFGKKNEEN